ncbi:short chain dehydrogenase [Schizosaccharomyces cryophilus OY26]|uniref:Short chain dehydrogenase n=1 Tax=Schizosaccharomyces cryophilus (strain OY26 / ATCC MYA-4695 / CBS 11777 / NBRC 106824 / NRRL Y48691) TaxID=653667 RepID=S9WZ72_SCHCR|nr:short chain dehydrogenase [Schizosaccharomyces cryophilus OY26]EPY50007.1 short chain dehydrogenase [Schizosaccharomyces cryophilus OY26]
MFHNLIDRSAKFFGVNTPNWSFQDIPDLHGKVAIVTGSSGGIGYITALQLAIKGAKVYLAGRNEEKYITAIKNIREECKNANVVFLHMDLLDFDSVYQATEVFLAKETKLDLLINNAGVMFGKYQLSKNGYEAQIQTNYLSHYLFTYRLIPALRRAAENSRPGDVRIVNVSSLSYFTAPYSGIYFPDINLPYVLGGQQTRYGQSKYANILHAQALAHRLEKYGIYAVSLHPGVVKTNLLQYSQEYIRKIMIQSPLNRLLLDPVWGAYTTLYAATSPTISEERLNGAFFRAVAQRSTCYRNHDPFIVNKLWEFTHQIFEKLQYLPTDDDLK